LAGWLLDLAPDEVQALAMTGLLRAQGEPGRQRLAALPCRQVWVARMFRRVQYPGDEQVVGTLSILAAAESELVRRAASVSLAATRPA
jgi:hypothetical protein